MVSTPVKIKIQPYIEVDHVDKDYTLANGQTYRALQGIHLKITQGEFISLIGHSGCGKSTLLNIIAGLEIPSQGGILMDGREVRDPGPDRMVVFQNYSLLPWLTVRENIALAVEEVLGSQSPEERQALVEDNIRRVGLQAAADKRPAHLSGGMKQRVAIARALAIRPRVLLLDEPFGALDALTRGHLQEQLMAIAEAEHLTCVMVTHDVDEALLLSDRVVMMTNGPAARIGHILDVPFARPRHRLEVVNQPDYYALRGEMLYFLQQQKRARKHPPIAVAIAKHGLEKVNLDLGFVPLTDCAPLVVAKETGLFQKYGLEQVNLVREPSWNAVWDGLRAGRVDAAAVVAGMPLASTLGMGGPPVPLVTALTLSRGGNAITLSRTLWEHGVRSLADFRRYVQQSPDKVHTLGMVHPFSMHNLLLRHWLASGGLDPDRDVRLTVVPPPQMVSHLKAGNLDGYCVGDPWNARAVREGLGVVMATSPEILPSPIEKVLAVRLEWAQQFPQTHLALVKALLEAQDYCDLPHHREQIAQWLTQPQYVGASLADLRPGLSGVYPRGTTDESDMMVGFFQFGNGRNRCPELLEPLWMLTQMARWGLCAFPKNWLSVLTQVLDSTTYGEAARALHLPDRPHERGSLVFGDGTVFDGQHPLEAMQKLGIPIQEYTL
ncbi:MAG: nitrate ABC transporter ATP-binding protein [Synechococcales cyanobacterium]